MRDSVRFPSIPDPADTRFPNPAQGAHTECRYTAIHDFPIYRHRNLIRCGKVIIWHGKILFLLNPIHPFDPACSRFNHVEVDHGIRQELIAIKRRAVRRLQYGFDGLRKKVPWICDIDAFLTLIDIDSPAQLVVGMCNAII